MQLRPSDFNGSNYKAAFLSAQYRVGLLSAQSGELEIYVPTGESTHDPIEEIVSEHASALAARARLAVVNHFVEEFYKQGGRVFQVKLCYRLDRPCAGVRFVTAHNELAFCHTCYGDPLNNVDGVRCVILWKLAENHIFSRSLSLPMYISVFVCCVQVLAAVFG
jgi:hypothetical protein